MIESPRFFVAGGSLAALMGAALILPVVVARIESGVLSRIGVGVISVGCGLVACGVMAILAGFRKRHGVLAGAFWSLGRPETRNYFRLARLTGT